MSYLSSIRRELRVNLWDLIGVVVPKYYYYYYYSCYYYYYCYCYYYCCPRKTSHLRGSCEAGFLSRGLFWASRAESKDNETDVTSLPFLVVVY